MSLGVMSWVYAGGGQWVRPSDKMQSGQAVPVLTYK